MIACSMLTEIAKKKLSKTTKNYTTLYYTIML